MKEYANELQNEEIEKMVQHLIADAKKERGNACEFCNKHCIDNEKECCEDLAEIIEWLRGYCIYFYEYEALEKKGYRIQEIAKRLKELNKC